MPRTAKPGMGWLHNIEIGAEYVEALNAYMQSNGANKRQAIETAISELPTFQNRIEANLPTWAQTIQKDFIEPQEPFTLHYQDASNRTFSWTVRYAEFATHENRIYLDFWANETADNHDIEPLRHNWCIRLDRIEAVEPIPIAGDWRDGLDSIDVEFHLFGGLSYAYAKESNGIKTIDWESVRVDALTRRVVRPISNTFWFLREMIRYGDECQIVSPKEVVNLMVAKLEKALSRYQ